ncbi:S-layer homology domain-containing protein [Desulfallas sp. Bu1-1]|uniref:S-layer homology domain-containing protein n=1 Tax=Desulfallas sp. Bu1-1 TaxID=2787620 RepID=UPI00189CCC07|nr:S-layer homology domain-containing protein [Desulfallas sp. Bu1-1]MBF7081623.1 S-layer homology domain-containing protein [Desulfallas sp. Bu1-1]
MGKQGFSPGSASDISLYVYEGTPYVAYSDGNEKGGASVMRYNGSGWVYVGTAGFSGDLAADVSLYVYGGIPYVAYSDGSQGGRVTVMKYNGLVWECVGNACFSDGAASDVSLYVYDGTPCVAYGDGGRGGRATVMRYNGTGWEPVGNAGFSTGTAYGTSLHVSEGTPYVAYSDGSQGGRATVMKHDGSNWVPVGNPGFSAGRVGDVSLYVSGGTPYVAYKDDQEGGKATVMSFVDGDWKAVGKAGFSDGLVYNPSLYVYSGIPYVAYGDDNLGGRAAVMKYDGNSWAPVGQPGFSGVRAYDTSLFMHNEIPYVAFRDGSSTKATVMKYKAVSIAPGQSMNEANLDGCSLVVALTGDTFKDAALDKANFTLNNAPAGTTISSVAYIDATHCTLNLAFDGTDFDEDVADFSVTVSGDELSEGVALTSNALVITALVESCNAGLAGLTLSSGTLAPAFDASVTEYTAVVDYGVDVIEVIATPADADAGMMINGCALGGGVPFTVNLNMGDNMIEIVVTAPDGVTRKVYTVTVRRQSDTESPTWLAGSSLSATSIGQTGLTLVWNGAVDNAGVTGYCIYRDGEPLDTVAGSVYSYAITGLTPGTAYTFCVQAGDAAGNWTSDGPTITVTTLPAETLAVTGTDPADGAVGVPLDEAIEVFFNRDITRGAYFPGISLTCAGTVIDYVYELSGNVLTLDPPGDLDYNVTCAVYIPAGAVEDLSGNPLADAYHFSFSTVSGPDDGKNKDKNRERLSYPEFSAGVITLSDLKITYYRDYADALIPAGIVQKYVDAGVGGIVVDINTIDRPVNITFPAGVFKILANKDAGITLDTPWCDLVIPPNTFGPGGDVTVSVKPVKITGNLSGSLVAAGGAAGVLVTGGEMRKKMTLVLAGDPGMVEDVTGLFIYRIDENGSYTCEGGTLEDGNVKVNLNHFSQYAVLEFKNPFQDITGHWAGRDILFITARGIAKGVAPNAFEPDREVTRAEFAALLLRALGLEEYRPGQSTFEDVAPGAWYCSAMEAAYKEGLVSGTGSGRFEPGRTITRQEVAAIMARALAKTGADITLAEEEKGELLSRFNDAPSISPWALEAVAGAVKSGLMQGNPDGAFAPASRVTRAQAAAIISRWIQGSGLSQL